MAQQGRPMQEILEQYFPGTQVADEATGRDWKSFAGDGFVLESLDASDATYLADLNRARAEATERSGLHALAPLTVRVFASTPAFREATLAPGWVAAFTEGDWIGTQPLRTLAARQLLAGTMRHEFLHALVEQQAGPRAPLWLREGLVEFWSEPSDDAQSIDREKPAPELTINGTDAALGTSLQAKPNRKPRIARCRVVRRATSLSLRARAGARLATLRRSRWSRRYSRAAVAGRNLRRAGPSQPAQERANLYSAALPAGPA